MAHPAVPRHHSQLVNTESELEIICICRSEAEFLVSQYDLERLSEVLEHAEKSPVSNPASFVVRALEQSWQFADVSCKSSDIVPADPMAYVGGKYAAYINH